MTQSTVEAEGLNGVKTADWIPPETDADEPAQPVVKQVVETLKCFLTEREITEHGRKMALLTQEMGQLQEEAKEVAAGYKAKLAAKQSAINSEAILVNNGFEFRPVRCDVLLNTPTRGEKTNIRTDTGEVVLVSRMSNYDEQFALDFQMTTDGAEPADEAESADEAEA